jgi:hypothetical protein
MIAEDVVLVLVVRAAISPFVSSLVVYIRMANAAIG